VSISDQVVSEGSLLSIAISASDIDGDLLTLSLEDATPSNVRITSDRNGQGYDTSTPGTDVINFGGTGFNSPGDIVTITLSDNPDRRMFGTLSELKVLDTGTSVESSGIDFHSIAFTGDGTNAAIVQLQVSFGTGPSGNVDIEYPALGIDLTNLLVITPTGAGTWDLTITPPSGSAGVHTVTMRASANGLIDEDVFTITVSSP